jgi:hypothetical protein
LCAFKECDHSGFGNTRKAPAEKGDLIFGFAEISGMKHHAVKGSELCG